MFIDLIEVIHKFAKVMTPTWLNW